MLHIDQIVKYLLRIGDDPTVKLKDNSSVLIEASRAGHLDIIEIVLRDSVLFTDTIANQNTHSMDIIDNSVNTMNQESDEHLIMKTSVVEPENKVKKKIMHDICTSYPDDWIFSSKLFLEQPSLLQAKPKMSSKVLNNEPLPQRNSVDLSVPRPTKPISNIANSDSQQKVANPGQSSTNISSKSTDNSKVPQPALITETDKVIQDVIDTHSKNLEAWLNHMRRNMSLDKHVPGPAQAASPQSSQVAANGSVRRKNKKGKSTNNHSGQNDLTTDKNPPDIVAGSKLERKSETPTQCNRLPADGSADSGLGGKVEFNLVISDGKDSKSNLYYPRKARDIGHSVSDSVSGSSPSKNNFHSSTDQPVEISLDANASGDKDTTTKPSLSSGLLTVFKEEEIQDLFHSIKEELSIFFSKNTFPTNENNYKSIKPVGKRAKSTEPVNEKVVKPLSSSSSTINEDVPGSSVKGSPSKKKISQEKSSASIPKQVLQPKRRLHTPQETPLSNPISALEPSTKSNLKKKSATDNLAIDSANKQCTNPKLKNESASVFPASESTKIPCKKSDPRKVSTPVTSASESTRISSTKSDLKKVSATDQSATDSTNKQCTNSKLKNESASVNSASESTKIPSTNSKLKNESASVTSASESTNKSCTVKPDIQSQLNADVPGSTTKNSPSKKKNKHKKSSASISVPESLVVKSIDDSCRFEHQNLESIKPLEKDIPVSPSKSTHVCSDQVDSVANSDAVDELVNDREADDDDESDIAWSGNTSPFPSNSCCNNHNCKNRSHVNMCTESLRESPLSLACAGGHLDVVKVLVTSGARLEHRNKKSQTPLHVAILHGHLDVIEYLLESNADIEAMVDRTKDTALSIACANGKLDIVKLLVGKGAEIEHRNISDYTPLCLAASGGYVDMILFLLSHNAEINSRTNSKLGISPLMLAAMNGHIEAVTVLLDHGSDVNAQIETNFNTALTLATFQGRTEVVSLLIDRKACVEHRAKSGLTPLMEAASQGHLEVGRLLIIAGADVNAVPAPSSRETALIIAAEKGHTEFVKLLLEHEAVVDTRNKKGNTPLWLACNGGYIECVILLIDALSDVNSADNRRVTCLLTAFKKGHVKVVIELVKYATQFPSEFECTKHIKSIRNHDKDIIKRCEECKAIILKAKEHQECEAAKNAKDLLKQVEEEIKVREQKEEKQAKKREKRKAKKKPKQDDKEVEADGDDDVTVVNEGSSKSTPTLCSSSSIINNENINPGVTVTIKTENISKPEGKVDKDDAVILKTEIGGSIKSNPTIHSLLCTNNNKSMNPTVSLPQKTKKKSKREDKDGKVDKIDPIKVVSESEPSVKFNTTEHALSHNNNSTTLNADVSVSAKVKNKSKRESKEVKVDKIDAVNIVTESERSVVSSHTDSNENINPDEAVMVKTSKKSNSKTRTNQQSSSVISKIQSQIETAKTEPVQVILEVDESTVEVPTRIFTNEINYVKTSNSAKNCSLKNDPWIEISSTKTPSIVKSEENINNWPRIGGIKRLLDIQVKKKDIGKVIGQAGSVIHAIRQMTGASIDIDCAINDLDERTVHLKGTLDAVTKARAHIYDLVDGTVTGSGIIKESESYLSKANLPTWKLSPEFGSTTSNINQEFSTSFRPNCKSSKPVYVKSGLTQNEPISVGNLQYGFSKSFKGPDFATVAASGLVDRLGSRTLVLGGVNSMSEPLEINIERQTSLSVPRKSFPLAPGSERSQLQRTHNSTPDNSPQVANVSLYDPMLESDRADYFDDENCYSSSLSTNHWIYKSLNDLISLPPENNEVIQCLDNYSVNQFPKLHNLNPKAEEFWPSMTENSCSKSEKPEDLYYNGNATLTLNPTANEFKPRHILVAPQSDSQCVSDAGRFIPSRTGYITTNQNRLDYNATNQNTHDYMPINLSSYKSTIYNITHQNSSIYSNCVSTNQNVTSNNPGKQNFPENNLFTTGTKNHLVTTGYNISNESSHINTGCYHDNQHQPSFSHIVQQRQPQEDRLIRLQDYINTAINILLQTNGSDHKMAEAAFISFMRSANLDLNSHLSESEFTCLINHIIKQSQGNNIARDEQPIASLSSCLKPSIAQLQPLLFKPMPSTEPQFDQSHLPPLPTLSTQSIWAPAVSVPTSPFPDQAVAIETPFFPSLGQSISAEAAFNHQSLLSNTNQNPGEDLLQKLFFDDCPILIEDCDRADISFDETRNCL